MKLIDTHCHLNADTFKTKWEAVIQSSKAVGVADQFVVGWDEASSKEAVRLATLTPSIKAIIGLHPVDVTPTTNLDWIQPLYQTLKDKVIAIGEIGLDYHWKKDPQEHAQQAKMMVAQIGIANELNLPVVIHCRDAYEAILPILKTNPIHRGGVMHCYAGPSQLVPDFLALGFYLSYGGPITFKKAEDARRSVQLTPLNRLLIETDSPYLSPDPLRGKENSPENLPIIFRKVCEIKALPAEHIAQRLLENVEKLFHVKTK